MRKLLLVDVPFTLVKEDLCPKDEMSIDTLKIISYLKKSFEVSFLETRSNESYAWKMRRAGLHNGVQIKTTIKSKPFEQIRKHLENIPYVDEIVFLCQMPLAPYNFDEEVVLVLKNFLQKKYPGVKISLTGNFVFLFPEFATRLNMDIMALDMDSVITEEPDFSAKKDSTDGLFQISYGCSNNCSFCTNSLNKPGFIPIDKVIKYMRAYYGANHPKNFSNWDPNVLQYPAVFKKFLDAYILSGMDSKLSFELGFQPDKIDDEIIIKLSKIGVHLVTVPFESGTVRSFSKIRKPYTIISSIKCIHSMNRFKDRFGKIQCSFIIGYPHDDFCSIFRIYISILKLNCVPLPFPLFIFPRTKEYLENADTLKLKDFSEFNGELWPLIPEDKIESYQNLLSFLKIRNLDEAISKQSLLSEDMKTVFINELNLSDKFLDMCLNAEDSSIAALSEIEQKLDSVDTTNILYITASPKPLEESSTKKLGAYLIEGLRKKLGDVDLNCIDLYSENLSFIDNEYLDIIYGRSSSENISEKTMHLNRFSEKAIRSFRQSDIVIIATPMWTLSIPAILKSFFEMIASKLFYEQKETLSKKKIFCIISRDGIYPNIKQINSQERTIVGALDFMGMGREIRFIRCQGMIRSDNHKSILYNAEKEIDELLARFNPK